MTKPLTMQERILLREGMIIKRFFDAGTGQMSAAKNAGATSVRVKPDGEIIIDLQPGSY